jgi:hypothetical protein
LANRVPIPAQYIFGTMADLSADEEARRYEASLRMFFGLKDGERPRFDLILHGME